MQGTIPAVRRKLIERIAAASRRLSRTGDALDVREFIRRYFRGVAEEDLAEYESADLAAAALAHLRFGAVRARNRPAVRIYNPDARRDGWSSSHTVVEIVAQDMPFLVDSLVMVLTQAGLTVHLMVHPVLTVRRDARGRIREIDEQDAARRPGATRESWQHMQIDRIASETQREALRDKLLAALEDTRLAVTDWRRMRQRALAIATEIEGERLPVPASEAQEIAQLLRWMEDHHFTFIGYREYRLRRGRTEDWLDPVPDTGLGILRKRQGRHESTRLTGDLRELARAPDLLTVTKANSISTVHRAVYLDYIGIRTFDAAGRVTGEKRFLGLFTSAAYNRSPREIPLLRQKVQRVIAHFGLDPTSHDGKAVEHVLETYPRDELFQARIPDLIRIVRGVVNLYERQRVRVFLRRDAFGRFYSGLIYVPRDRYNTQVRERMEAVMREQLRASSVDSQVQLSESALARIHMIVRVPQEKGGPRVDVDALEKRIADTVHTWHDRLREALIAAHGESQGIALAERYEEAFPAAYQEDVDVAWAVDDIQQIEELIAQPNRITMRLVKDDDGQTHLRLFRSDAAIPLSSALPVLENMGFLVVSERPYRIAAPGEREVWLQNFEMQPRGVATIDPAQLGQRFTEAFLAVWNGDAENDGFNRLLVSTELTWREAMVLRAYCKYLLQTGSTFSQTYMEQVLLSNSSITSALLELFRTQFDPELPDAQRRGALNQLERRLARLFDAVKSLDEDRILRRFWSVISATLRTNYFQSDAQGRPKPYLSFKLDSRSIVDLPLPRPAFEIFVYSPRVEGVHLRMGHVARGGIRWSDRREDFRTEVLGLLKAQNVKNTLIVPVGAKGGFVPKRLPTNGSRDDVQREAIECYSTFIRGLLDLTDNIVDARIAPPPRVVRRDGDDAYLVVAADKGTATFSDIANRIAAEYDFWLGDAFASGGSSGYDHKKMGITARGAWESVKRHFREIGIDSQTQDFTVVGIGDMSGDVFGNGMLLSRHIKLLAAFNHQHIFLDPSPDPQVSYEERRRLFALPRSTWEDYNPKLISRGGGVFSRSAKTIRLSPQVQAMLGVKRDSMTPPELIRAVLCMPVDLLWNGGIGTYVKASTESHLDIGDRANDALRVNANELRCKIVGEGGNLGFSQRARVEYALNGGRINTDFIDNSGGVDCSDHEVNIKILFNSAPRRSRIGLRERDRLLARMTEEVATLVLRDNYMQTQALSVLELRAAKDLLEHAHSIRSLELSGHLDRTLEFLPPAEEIEARHKAGAGLTRPELAILLAYSKMALYSRLIDSDVPEDPYLRHELERYFPAVLQQRCRSYLHQHRLRREIIATATTNSMVNRMGPTFARRVQDDTGANAATVVRAFAISREAFRMRATWSAIEALDNKIEARSQYEMLFETARLLRFTTYWLIRSDADRLDIEAQVSRLQPGFSALDDALPRVLAGVDLASFESLREHYRAAKVPDSLARRMASLPALRSAPDLVEISAQCKLPIATAAEIYFGVGTALSLDWLRQQIEDLAIEGHWQAVARATLRDTIYNLQRVLCLQVIRAGRRLSPQRALESWLAARRPAVDSLRQSIADMKALPDMDFATLSVALQAVRRLSERQS
jgi:glutamate dehydrogenase